MMKVRIIEKYNTSFGSVIITDDNQKFAVGEKILCDDDTEYTILGFQMPTTPQNNVYGIIVQN